MATCQTGSCARYCMVCMTNLYTSPFYQTYLDVVPGPCDLIYWNRDGAQEKEIQAFSRVYAYHVPIQVGKQTLRTALHYFAFARFVRRILHESRYDRVIFLHQQLPPLLGRRFRNMYEGRYVYDVRDYFFNGLPLYRAMERDIVRKAGLNVVSSAGYTCFLPAGKYHVLHNLRKLPDETIQQARTRQRAHTEPPYTLANVGNIRANKRNKRLLKLFGRDERFRLAFLGSGALALLPLIQAGGYANILLEDRFPLSETQEKFSKANLVYNLFGHGKPMLDYAMSNKLYYAAQLGRPILVSPHTYIAQQTEAYGIGLALSLSDPRTPQKAFEYYQQMQWDTFFASCDRFLSDVQRENEETLAHLRAFLALGERT